MIHAGRVSVLIVAVLLSPLSAGTASFRFNPGYSLPYESPGTT